MRKHSFIPRKKAERFILAALFITLLVVPLVIFQSGPLELRSRSAPAAETTTIRGVVTIDYIDTHDEGYAEVSVRTDDNKMVKLVFTDSIPSELIPGSLVKAEGVLKGDTLTVQAKDIYVFSAATKSEVTTQQTGPKVTKSLVMLVNFQNKAEKPFSAAEIKKYIYTDQDSVKNYFLEASYGQYELQGLQNKDGDVIDWVTIPYSLPPENESVDCLAEFKKWSDAANIEINKTNRSLDGYALYMYLFPPIKCKVGTGMGGGGINSTAYVWLAQAPLQENLFMYKSLVAHEIGHTLGMHHASAYDCTDGSGKRVTFGSNCTRHEYSDPFSVMGSGSFTHMTNYHKEKAGWLTADSSQTITKSGTYTISPLEKQTSAHPITLKIPRASTEKGLEQFYYLEYRQPSLFDKEEHIYKAKDVPTNIFNGISLRIAPFNCPIPPVLCTTMLLDTTPQTTNFTDAALTQGQKYVDEQNKITIETISVTKEYATVNVTMNGTVPTGSVQPTTGPTPVSTSGPTQQPTIVVPNGDAREKAASLNITLHGIGAGGDKINTNSNSLSNKNPLHKERNIKLTILENETIEVKSFDLPVYFDTRTGYFKGAFFIQNLPVGSYTLKLKTDRYLEQNVKIEVNETDTIAIPSIDLTTGDVNDDNKLDALDYNTFLDCGYGSVTPVSLSNPKSLFHSPKCKSHPKAANTDLDDNGVIDSKDYNLFLRELTASNI